MLWVGIDVGGTFTDAVVYDDSSQLLHYAKSPSTPEHPTVGVLDVLDRLELDMSVVQRLVHGLTIGTNAILERKGAEVWMLTTRGFRDVLEIARTNRPVLYNIKTLKAEPLVPRTRTLEVDERLHYDGSVRAPLDEASVRQAARRIPSASNGAIAICFLHSYANPAHERAAAEIVARELPDWFVCTSSEVLSQFREYERFNTAALNSYIGPLMSGYLDDLRGGLSERGYDREIYIMTSNGGVSTVERVKRMPISTVLSGPAGGVAAAVDLGSRVDIANLITCDMGGTSTDVCLIEDLNVPVTNEQSIGGYANRTPQIEINAVGAGGGSIAWLDAGDILMVGPQSAGADPGPACYGHGGIEPTVTDANLVLHRLKPAGQLGGRIGLDEALALQAIRPLKNRLPGLDDHALAEGIIRIAVARMVSAIKEISIAKGFDPRDFVLVAYGGAGPMHVVFIAEELEISRVLIPLGPGNFAAFGSLISDIRQDHILTRTMLPRQTDFADITGVFAEMESEGKARLIEEGVPAEDIILVRSLGMRYLGQSWELEVPIPDTIDSLDTLEDAFYQVHERRFGHKSGDQTEIVNFRIATIARVTKPELPNWAIEGSVEDAIVESRSVYFDGEFQDVPVYDRSRLPCDARADGPAIVEESGSTTVVPPYWRFSVLEYGDLLLEQKQT
jgi:N-methylhydantoinase A